MRKAYRVDLYSGWYVVYATNKKDVRFDAVNREGRGTVDEISLASKEDTEYYKSTHDRIEEL